MIERFTSRLTIGDGDDKHWLLQLSGTSWLDYQWLQDLGVQFSAQGCHSGELDLREELRDLLLISNAIALDLRIHEADLDAIGVEQRCCEGDPVKDELEVINALAILFKGH